MITGLEIRAKNNDARLILQAAANGNVDYFNNNSISNDTIRTAVCSSGCTALHWAAGNNQIAMLDYLIHHRQVFTVDVPAVKKSRGRTALHYSCRNGCLEASRWLVEKADANVDPRAKHGVTPFQLAVWQNQLSICQWLVEEQGVDPCQVNDFDCGAVHWLGICPQTRVNMEDGSDLLPLTKWLAKQPGIDFTMQQRQGHTPLHKAAWGGHLALIQYLRNDQNLWDNIQDDAGNFAADLADMAHTARHAVIAKYLRQHCSRAKAASCAILGIEPSSSRREIRKAYMEKARLLHPDRQRDCRGDGVNDFHALHKAYVHLLQEDGHGNQSNPAHSLNLMLQVSGLQSKLEDDSCFKARLIAVLLEYGDKGLDLSNVKKKWKQVWPKEPFPNEEEKQKISDFLMERAGDVIELVHDGKGAVRVFAKDCSQAKVREASKLMDEKPGL